MTSQPSYRLRASDVIYVIIMHKQWTPGSALEPGNGATYFDAALIHQ